MKYYLVMWVLFHKHEIRDPHETTSISWKVTPHFFMAHLDSTDRFCMFFVKKLARLEVNFEFGI